MPSWLTLKLGGMIVGGLAILAFVLLAFHWKDQAKSRSESLAIICQATRDASGQPKLKCGDVAKQIKFMGETIGAYSKALDAQSARVAALGAETERQSKIAAEASQEARERARAPARVSDSLLASSRSGERLAKPCEPSKALTGAWK